ncbi:MAG: hypothetical protein KJO91_04615 [Gammaproteobacteria bacterium]|nr:hypothetical protein [Gammaproteobacteria bacterium]
MKTADGRHPSNNVTSFITVDIASQTATAIGTYNFLNVATNDLVALSDGIFGIDHINDVLHLINPSTGNLEKSIDLSENGTYFGLAAVVPIPPAIWLFGGGLIGLIGVARRKKA